MQNKENILMTKERYAARVFLINADNEILLLHIIDPKDLQSSPYWITPGGQMEKDETPEQAVRRELYEETGIVDADFIVPHLFYLEEELLFRNELTLFKEYFFVAHVQHANISTQNFTLEEKLAIHTYKWWSLKELQETTERIYPLEIIDLIKPLIKKN